MKSTRIYINNEPALQIMIKTTALTDKTGHADIKFSIYRIRE